MPDEPEDQPKREPGPPIDKELGNEEEIRGRLNALGISYDLPLQAFADIATDHGNHPATKLRAAEELAKVMRLYADKNRNATVVQATGERVKIYLPDNGRDDEKSST